MPELITLVALPHCHLGMRSNAQGLIEEIVFQAPDTALKHPGNALEQLFARQVTEYLHNPQHILSLPLAPRGTVFQQRVWHAIRNIPCGHSRNYGELASDLSSAPRAIGQACGANPFPLITPCHRVLGKSGLGGFAHAQNGWLLETKKWLLQHEGVI